MENVVLFGNGLNRVTEKSKNIEWNTFLADAAKNCNGSGVEKIPEFKGNYTYLHEYYVSNIGSNKCINSNAVSLLRNLESNELYDALCDLDFEYYLTTNYDESLEKAFEKKAKAEKKEINCKKNRKYYETKYSLRTNTVVEVGDKKNVIWHIHGDISRTNSIQLGFEHYCTCVEKINQSFRGSFENTNPFKKLLESTDIEIWVELFFKRNIYIVGLGLEFSEIDIWLILNKRKKMKDNPKYNIENKITYYDVGEEENVEKKLLLESFDVQYKFFKLGTGNYKEQYKEILEIIKNKNRRKK